MLTTVAACKTWIGIESTDTTYDDEIETILKSVGTQFDNYLNRKLEAAEYTLYLDGKGTYEIFTPVYPIVSITSIHDDPDRVYGNDSLLTDYILYEDFGKIISPTYGFYKGYKNIKIIGTFGYTTSGVSITLPEDLKKAALDQVKFLFQKWKKNEEEIVSYSTINNSVNLIDNTEMLNLVKTTLDRYRNYYHG
jgi:hypothetical protein